MAANMLGTRDDHPILKLSIIGWEGYNNVWHARVRGQGYCQTQLQLAISLEIELSWP